ncbi:putative disease resistance protein At1g50180 [Coffea eugenioides]|uniref:putative disease resistance protein At1g50180 n=1 Tax=Coffea eugenioides TaxID=49369 RepID=UPI000F60F218|nr:putative disease resistance protein At1g50180 [Coffea eugenioides]
MAGAIVSLVLQTLGNMLKDEARFLSGVTDQVEEVRRELKRMLCFLKDADARNCKDETIRNWLREIRSLAYRIEDLVETFAIEVASRRSSGHRGVKKVLKRVSGTFAEIRSLHNIGVEITKVKSDLSSLTASLQMYDVRAIGEAESSSAANDDRKFQQWIRQTYAHEVEDYFVGMEDDIANLVSLVIDDDKRHRVISIWGMGGLGKTTLARKVYKHIAVQRSFERFAWTCVTQEGQMKAILQDLLMQLHPQKQEDVKFMGHRQLVQQLHQVQIEKKCLVVLDDIWKVDDWKSLLAAFPVVERDIKVLLTTRNRNVAKKGCLYELKCLNEMEGWELLQKIAFARKRADLKIERNLQDVGIEMVSKCGGLPLAITVLGGILKDKNSFREWQMVNRYIGSYLSKVEDDEERDGGSIARVLSLSYNELPHHLKLCFLYLGNFKEDEDIRPQHLYLLWMAEGMVLKEHQRSGETLMEVAQRYLSELGRRSMVQLKLHESSMSRKFVSCRLHDMMRDLCLQKGREEEFVRVVDFQGVQPQPLLHSYSLTNNAHRLVIHAQNEEDGAATVSSALEDCQQLRSLFCLKAVAGFWEPQMLWPQGVVLKNFKSLRVLKFEGFDFDGKKLPIQLPNLVHLRLLSLKFCKLDELPSAVADLPLLQTLDLEVKNEIKIPNVLWKMKRLKHLFLSFKHSTMDEGGKLQLHGLSELETLWALDSKTDEIADLLHLENLRILYAKVNDDESLQILMNRISLNCPNLRELDLFIGDCNFISSEQGHVLLEEVLLCKCLQSLYFEAQLNQFPKYDQPFLQSLVALRLTDNYMEEDPMETLAQLPQLQSLTLGYKSYMGDFLICHESGFPQLGSLILCRLPNLEYWRLDEGCMPNLSHLEIWYCELLAMIPHGLRSALGLKELVIGGMPNEFCDRVKVVDGQEGADFYKIQHVPSISIHYDQ